MSDSWNSKVAWMRAKGVLQAQWNVDDGLMMAVLGPEVFSEQVGPSDQPAKNNEPTYEELLLASAG